MKSKGNERTTANEGKEVLYQLFHDSLLETIVHFNGFPAKEFLFSKIYIIANMAQLKNLCHIERILVRVECLY